MTTDSESQSLLHFKKRLAVFCSGGGSNFRAIHSGIAEKNLPAEIVLCLSNLSQCGAMDFARSAGIEALHLPEKQFATSDAFAEAMTEALHRRRIDFVLLAGYLKKIPAAVVQQFPKQILNIHPALLPKFGGDGMYGHFVHEAVIAAGERESGATVHFVDAEYDKGEIVLQSRVTVELADTAETLAAKVLATEHTLYTDALQKILYLGSKIPTDA